MPHFEYEYRGRANGLGGKLSTWHPHPHYHADSVVTALDSGTGRRWLTCGSHDGVGTRCQHRIVMVHEDGHRTPVFYPLHHPHPVLQALGFIQ